MIVPLVSGLLLLARLSSASPTARAAAAVPAYPTATPVIEIRVVEERNIISDVASVASDATNQIGSVLTSLGSAIPSYVASGVPNFFQGFPVGGDVQKSLNLSDAQVTALPVSVLNIPPYANWTGTNWNIRLHGNVYKQPNISTDKLNNLANIFLIDTDVTSLPESQQEQARNLTSEIFVIQQADETLEFTFLPITSPLKSNSTLTPNASIESVTLPYKTTAEGDFDVFLNLTSFGLSPGDATTQIQAVNVFANGTTSGNATAYFVPSKGITIISDIDDILRITKIYQPAEGLLNSFAKPFTSWMTMPEVYSNLSTSLPDLHFHYLTTTPEQITRSYMQYIYTNYPLGSFDTRPLNFSDISATLSIRRFLLDKIFLTFPERKFILVGDTSNSDIMKAYPALVKDYPGQVQCIWLRNTSATDSGDKFPYDTSGFEGVDQKNYMFFVTPADLVGLDVQGGQCYNSSVKQNVTFSYQGLPFGLSKKSASPQTYAAMSMALVYAFVGFVAFLL